MRMVLGIATREWSEWKTCVMSWQVNASLGHLPYSAEFGKDVLPAYQYIYEHSEEEIIGYVHDDLVCLEYAWDARILREFSDPQVGVVGVAGALGHGHPDLYKGQYHLPKLARQSFLSNMENAEQHGGRFAGARDVAILDGMAIFVRRTILDKMHGWPLDKPIGYWLYCEHLCCEARRQGSRIRLVGIKVNHLGGKSSGFISPAISYEEAHRYLYENNRDCLPYRVED